MRGRWLRIFEGIEVKFGSRRGLSYWAGGVEGGSDCGAAQRAVAEVVAPVQVTVIRMARLFNNSKNTYGISEKIARIVQKQSFVRVMLKLPVYFIFFHENIVDKISFLNIFTNELPR